MLERCPHGVYRPSGSAKSNGCWICRPYNSDPAETVRRRSKRPKLIEVEVETELEEPPKPDESETAEEDEEEE